MISDTDVEKAIDYLRDNARKEAQARANYEYVSEYRKVLKSQIMRENTSEAIGNQEARAYADPRYIEHLKAIKEAAETWEYLRFMREAARAKLDAWQTQSANNRSVRI